jgi:hypothetical protein
VSFSAITAVRRRSSALFGTLSAPMLAGCLR